MGDGTPETEAELEAFRQQWREEVTARNRRAGGQTNDIRQSETKVSVSSKGSAGPSTARRKDAIDYSDDFEPRAYHDLPDKEEHLKLGVDGQNHDRDVDREPSSALEHYERAVEKETQGQLGDSMRHYRKAFKLDDGVHEAYKRKHFPPSFFAKHKSASQNVFGTTVTASEGGSHGQDSGSAMPPTVKQLIDGFSALRIEAAAPPSDASPQEPSPFAQLPEEILSQILNNVASTDVASFARLSQVCKRLAFLVMTEESIWKQVALGERFGFKAMHYDYACDLNGKPLEADHNPDRYLDLPSDNIDEGFVPVSTPDERQIAFPALTDALLRSTYSSSYRLLFRSRPRVRFNGCYISTVNYTRAGGNNTNTLTWGAPVHVVTYFRYLRFFRDGTCISLLTTSEPMDVVHHLTKENLTHANAHTTSLLPSSVMKDALRGRWRLSGPSSSTGAETEGDVHVETVGVTPKYTYRMLLALAHAGKAARNNKLAWKGFWSWNRLTDDWGEFGLRNDRAFYWSRVGSYGMDTPPMRLLRWAVVLSTGRSLGFADQQIVLADDTENTVKPYNVAIVGAGAAGSSSAYHLSKYAAEAGIPVNITIFERNTYIGGRSTTTYAYGEPAYPVELGASIFVEVNQILVSAVDEFNLSTSASQAAGEPKVPGAALAVWDGKTFVVSMNSEGGWWDIARLLWKYGLAPIRTINLMKATVVKFSKMYTTPIFPFTSLGQAVQDVGLLPVTASTGEQYMLENGITGAFGHDVVQASTRVNYAQNLNRIHGLEAMVCMATDGAMAVAGGNWQIFEQMVLASRATILLETAVTEIRRERSGHYALSFSSSPHQSKAAEETEQNETQDFDTLILASPLQFSNISFSPPLSYPPDRIPYVRLHVTLFTSRHLLSPTFFGLPSTQPVPKVILTTTPSSPNDSREVPLEFFSISLLRTVINPETEDPEYLYKIFSPTPLSRGWIVKLLGQQRSEDPDSSIISWLETKVWDSYPYEFPRVTFDELQFPWADAYGEEATTRIKRLNGTGMNWYYTSSIESFISTMETCALMGKNVAAIIVDAFKSREGVHTGM
nr:farnesylcysteine lyase [Quercus suber]